MPLIIVLLLLLPVPALSFLNDAEIAGIQRQIEDRPVGERIAFWAEKFIGTPYDTDPLGQYVSSRAIVADDRVDCMYHVFRSAELALSRSPEDAIDTALDKRFITIGAVENGAVLNYEDRFQYGEDMLFSGKWGKDITATVAGTVEIEGSRGREKVNIIPKENIAKAALGMKSGDIIFFVKRPEKRVVGEIVGHLGVISREGEGVYLTHASGKKGKGGEVRKTPLLDYASEMSFAGIMLSRF